MSEGELIIYTPDDGAATIGLRAVDGTVWLSQREIAELDVAQKLAVERFETFDANRRATEALAADETDIAQLEEMEKAARGRKKGSKDV